MAHHKLTIQPGDTLEVTVDDPELEELEDEEEDDDVLDDDDEDDKDDDEEDPEEAIKNIPQDVLNREIERRKKLTNNDD